MWSEYLFIFIYLIILKFYASTRVVKNYSTPIWSRVLALLELLGTALVISQLLSNQDFTNRSKMVDGRAI